MKTNSNTDFDRLEKLLSTKHFDDLNTTEKQWVKDILSEEEYTSISMVYTTFNKQKQSEEINPKAITKEKLNKALAAKTKHSNIFQLRMPVYQSVSAAVIVFMIGLGMNLSHRVETKIIHDTVQVTKYITRPEKQYNLALETRKQRSKEVKQITTNSGASAKLPTQNENIVLELQTNPEIIRQQDITLSNINHVLNETNGSNLGEDSVLQEMQVTIY